MTTPASDRVSAFRKPRGVFTRIALFVAGIAGLATASFAQPNFTLIAPLNGQLAPAIHASRTVTIQGGGLWFLDARNPDQYNLGLNVIISPASSSASEHWILTEVSSGLYTIRQQSSGQYLDAHEIPSLDYRVVTRNLQNVDQTQFWRLQDYGGGFYTIQQASSGRFLEPYLDAAHGYAVVTRTAPSQQQTWRISDIN